MYDIIIVGGGMAGLYTGYLLKKYTNLTFLIIEKKSYFGGRAKNDKFAGENVFTGAGVGRKCKDKLLLKLLKDLDIPIQYFKVNHSYSPKVGNKDLDISKHFEILKKEFKKQNQPMVTFKEFALNVWGDETYKKFILLNGYTDMENEDVFQTLFHYGIEDNFKSWTSFNVDWDLLVKKMCNYIGSEHLKKYEPVESIERYCFGFKIYTKQKYYNCKQLILATTIDVIQKLKILENHNHIYSLIQGQSFLRTYIQVDNNSIEILKKYIQGSTKVSNILQKIIPIQKDKGIYMVAYSDNKQADKGKCLNKTEITRLIRKEFEIKEPIKVNLLKHYYWKIGTHYFKPLIIDPKKFLEIAQYPEKDIFVVGESVSLNQGWVEGALESVKILFFENFIFNKWQKQRKKDLVQWVSEE